MIPVLPQGPPRLRPWPVPTAEAVVVPDTARCPECAGDWWRGLTSDHSTACSVRDQQDATQAADAEFFRSTGTGPRTRPATPAERLLGAALGLSVPEDALTVTCQYTRGDPVAVQLGRSSWRAWPPPPRSTPRWPLQRWRHEPPEPASAAGV